MSEAPNASAEAHEAPRPTRTTVDAVPIYQRFYGDAYTAGTLPSDLTAIGTLLQGRTTAEAEYALATHSEAFRDHLRQLAPEEAVRTAYRAVLDREPDEEGQRFHLNAVAQGRQPEEMIRVMMDSEEYRDRSLRMVYGELLDRQPDTEGSHGYQRFMAGGASIEEVATSIREGGEYQERIARLPQEQQERTVTLNGTPVYEVLGRTFAERLLATGESITQQEAFDMASQLLQARDQVANLQSDLQVERARTADAQAEAYHRSELYLGIAAAFSDMESRARAFDERIKNLTTEKGTLQNELSQSIRDRETDADKARQDRERLQRRLQDALTETLRQSEQLQTLQREKDRLQYDNETLQGQNNQLRTENARLRRGHPPTETTPPQSPFDQLLSMCKIDIAELERLKRAGATETDPKKPRPNREKLDNIILSIRRAGNTIFHSDKPLAKDDVTLKRINDFCDNYDFRALEAKARAQEAAEEARRRAGY